MDLCGLKWEFHQLLYQRHDLCVETARKRDDLLRDFNEQYEQLDEKIICVEQKIHEALFVEYCNTPCWRYQC